MGESNETYPGGLRSSARHAALALHDEQHAAGEDRDDRHDRDVVVPERNNFV